MDTIAACGDVNRNVMCTPLPFKEKMYDAVQDFSKRLSDHLTPATRAYHEIWLDGEQVAGGNNAFKVKSSPWCRFFVLLTFICPNSVVEAIVLNSAPRFQTKPLAPGEEEEPLYGKLYLPRKFKAVVAVPPQNDVDIFAHDLGYIAIEGASHVACTTSLVRRLCVRSALQKLFHPVRIVTGVSSSHDSVHHCLYR